MAFLTKQEQVTVNLIRQNTGLSLVQQDDLIKDIKYMARLRQEGYRKPVKIFLSVLSHFENNKALAGVIRP